MKTLYTLLFPCLILSFAHSYSADTAYVHKSNLSICIPTEKPQKFLPLPGKYTAFMYWKTNYPDTPNRPSAPSPDSRPHGTSPLFVTRQLASPTKDIISPLSTSPVSSLGESPTLTPSPASSPTHKPSVLLTKGSKGVPSPRIPHTPPSSPMGSDSVRAYPELINHWAQELSSMNTDE